jgi:hypothetical protein
VLRKDELRVVPNLLERRDLLTTHLEFGRIVVSENRGTKHVSKSGLKWMSGSTKRQCDRALRAPPTRARRARRSMSRLAESGRVIFIHLPCILH